MRLLLPQLSGCSTEAAVVVATAEGGAQTQVLTVLLLTAHQSGFPSCSLRTEAGNPGQLRCCGHALCDSSCVELPSLAVQLQNQKETRTRPDRAHMTLTLPKVTEDCACSRQPLPGGGRRPVGGLGWAVSVPVIHRRHSLSDYMLAPAAAAAAAGVQ